MQQGASQQGDDMREANVLVYNSGNVVWIPNAMYKIPCKPDPNDAGQLVCSAITGSWAHSAAQIAVELEEMDTSMMDPTPGVELVKASVSKDDKVFPCCPDDKYSIVSFDFGT